MCRDVGISAQTVFILKIIEFTLFEVFLRSFIIIIIIFYVFAYVHLSEYPSAMAIMIEFMHSTALHCTETYSSVHQVASINDLDVLKCVCCANTSVHTKTK